MDGVNEKKKQERKGRREKARKKERKGVRLIGGMKYALFLCNDSFMLFQSPLVVLHFYSNEAILLAVVMFTYLA